jgi:glucose-1-phosphatase
MTAPPVEAILFDLGNVLVFHDDTLLLRQLGAHAGLTADQVRLAIAHVWAPCNVGALGGHALRAEVARALGVALDEPTFVRLWNCHFRRHEAVLPVIEALVGRVRLLLLSNTNDVHFEFLRPQLPVLEKFDDLVLSYQIGAAKPDERIFHEALRRAGTRPEATAYFDDIAAYVDAARQLGIRGQVFTDAPSFARQLTELGLRI